MFANLSNFFQKNGIELYAPIPLSSCRIRKPYLLERAGIGCTGTAILFAVPYRTPACEDSERNLSAYAVARDYHAYLDSLFASLLPILQNAFPDARFVGFADHSPIDEVDAAARARLGVLGENGLLLTERYSSFVFLGGIYTNLALPTNVGEPRHCDGCGACRRACPSAGDAPCLSALTQKKGALSAAEEAMLVSHGTVWGCDVCQDVCPYTVRAMSAGTIYTKIPYFYESPIPTLTSSLIEEMTEDEFLSRAYAWRKRDTIARNLNIIEKGVPSC